MRSLRSRGPHAEGELEETRIYTRRVGTVKSGRRWLKIAGLVLLGVLLFLGGMAYGMLGYIKGYEPPGDLTPEKHMDRINILVLGIDGGVNGGLLKYDKTGTRSDVMVVVSVDPETTEVGVLSIPRDTRVFIPKINDLEKVAHAHAYGGPELSVETVEEFLKINIDRYVRVDFEGFKKVVDILGGLEIDVPQNMSYDDPYQNLHIHLKAGRQVLDGEKALEFVRYRSYPDGDIGRIRAQQQFLKALLTKALSIGSLTKIPSLIAEVKPYVVTDLTPEEMLYLAKIGLKVKPENVKMAVLPGEASYITDGDQTLSYWVADRQKMAPLVDELIRGIDRTKNANIKVAVQNGCGVSGAADYLASILRGQGFNVVSVSNANRMDYEETRVIGRGDDSQAQSVVLRNVLATCRQARTYKSNDVPSGADVLVIIGKDFNPLTGSSGT